MDPSAFHAAHRADGKGQKAHNPAIMLGVLLYGYCQGERSSPQLERLCQDHAEVRPARRGLDHAGSRGFPASALLRPTAGDAAEEAGGDPREGEADAGTMEAEICHGKFRLG